MDRSGTHNPWNAVFGREGRVFDEPHEDIPRITRLLKERGARRVLDLGCGSGRHVIYLAREGFSVYGLDEAPEALALTGQWLEQEGLQADLQQGNMVDALPYPDASFDAVISVQVIHHARLATIRGIVAEIARVLAPGGTLFVTVTLLKAGHNGAFLEIEPNTFVPLDGREKGMPHHRFTPQELRETFAAFEGLDLYEDSVQHICLTAFKPALLEETA
jgi:SAM-dependent methyltransferase